MRMWAKSTTGAVLMAGFVAFGSGVGYADTTSGDGSVAGGNQIQAPISAPVNVGGNAGTVGGQSAAKTKGGSSVTNVDQGGPGNTTSGDGGVGSGNQLYAPASAPVDVSGNSLSGAGQSAAQSEGGASVTNTYNGADGMQTSGVGGVLSGNQAYTPVSAPIEVSGNAVAVFGQAAALSRGGSAVSNGGGGGTVRHMAAGDGLTSSGDGGVLSGNQLVAPISIPIDVCGNAIAGAGQALAMCEGGASVNNDSSGTGSTGDGATVTNAGVGGGTTSGDGGVLSGNQLVAPVSAPVNICGNAVAALGQAAAMCEGGASVHNSGLGAGTTSGDGGLGAGNQLVAPISAPVNICGNAIAVAGQAFAMCEGGASVTNSGVGGGNTTSGDIGLVAGNQAVAPVSAPVNVCGNAVAALGQAAGMCESGGVGTPPPGNPPGEEPPGEEPPGEEPPSEEPPAEEPPGEVTPPGSDVVDGLTPVKGSLPMTGLDAPWLIALAAGAMLAGGAATVASRRRGVGRS